MYSLSLKINITRSALFKIFIFDFAFLQAAWIVESNRPPKGWPSTGGIVFDKYSVRYREGLDLVLKQVECSITGGEKVSVIRIDR